MSDYMVSRKRKRHAIDPCLGFYLFSDGKAVSSPSFKSSNNFPTLGSKELSACTEDTFAPSSNEHKLGAENICDASHSQHLKILPDYEVQHTPKRARLIQPAKLGSENLNSSSNIASDTGQLMMTVEDFLKRSTKREAVVKKQYGKPKRRIRRLGDNCALFEAERQRETSGSDAEDTGQDIMQLRSKKIRRATMYESSSDESSFNPEGSSPSLIKKSRSRTSKPLKERLYEAAVLTHGHPDDILVHDATTGSNLPPSRRPLRFIPSTQPEVDDDQMDKRRPRTWSLVDPRKSMAMNSARFSSKTRPCLQQVDSASSGKTTNLSLQPLKRWKLADASLSSLGNPKSNRQPKIPVVKKAYEYPPLAFVSLKEAEEGYKSIFSSGHHKRNGRLPGVYISTLPMVSAADTVPCIEGCISNPILMVPLEGVIQRPNFATEASVQVAVDQIRTLDNLNAMPSASLSSSPIINSVSSPIAQALPITPKSTQDGSITRIIPARRGSSRANVKERASMRRGSDVTPKPMRPLASLFKEFIQNIRNIAISQDQPSAPDKHLVSKRPLRRASRNECIPRQCHIDDMQLQSGATNLTGKAEGIFILQQPRTNDLESIRQNDPNCMNHMDKQGTPGFPYNRCLSPDILALLEPHNHQVILSSPS